MRAANCLPTVSLFLSMFLPRTSLRLRPEASKHPPDNLHILILQESLLNKYPRRAKEPWRANNSHPNTHLYTSRPVLASSAPVSREHQDLVLVQ